MHVTVDIDFKTGQLYVILKNNDIVREFTDTVTKNLADFQKGLSSIKFCGNKKSVSNINFYDNVKITPIKKNEISDITVADNKAAVSIKADAGFDKPFVLFAADYNTDGTIKSVSISQPKSFAEGTADDMEVSVEGMDADSLKIFLWDSALKPIKVYTPSASENE